MIDLNTILLVSAVNSAFMSEAVTGVTLKSCFIHAISHPLATRYG